MGGMKHGTRSGYRKHNCRCVECRDWERDNKARQRARQRGEEPDTQRLTLVNGVLPPDDPETRAAYFEAQAALNGTASPEVQARWDENMANRTIDGRRHGTITGYYTDHCRCDSCRTAAREYQRLRRAGARQKRTVGHGTTSGYVSGCRDNCPNTDYTCRDAMRDYQREYKRRKREQAGVQSSRGFSDADLKPAVTIPEAQHGTPTGYVKGCRCEDCRTAMREYQREYRERKRAEKTAGRAQQSGEPGLARDGFAPFSWEVETN